jgi:hypothetical protein
MRPGSEQISSYHTPASLRSRVIGWLLALAVTAMIVLGLIEAGALGPRLKEVVPKLITFRLQREPPAHVRKTVQVENSSRAVEPRHQAHIPPLNMVIVTRKEFADSDIATLPSHKQSGTGTASESQSNSSAGTGPNGETLYDVDWYRKPTHAEMAPYMPATGPEAGWAMIACRMVEKYHVEDCRELGESPAGSGLSRALREASWQFLVRPPRLGGKPIIGGWVRIRFDFIPRAAGDKDDGESGG